MAPVSLECAVGDGECTYRTQELEFEQAERVLELHMKTRHPVQVDAAPGTKNKAEKVPRPVIKMQIGQDDFEFFKSLWTGYKRASNLTNDVDIRDQLLAACDTDLRRDLHRSMGSALDTAMEKAVLKEIEQLAVLSQSNLVNVVKLLATSQDRDETVRSYLARLKGAAAVCKLTVTCYVGECTEEVSYSTQLILHSLVKGLADTEIREEVLSKTEVMTLDETVKFVEAKEAGRCSAGQLGDTMITSTPGIDKISAYQRGKTDKLVASMGQEKGSKCRYCNRKGHGVNAKLDDRKTSCPAYGKQCNKCERMNHFAVICKSGDVKVSVDTVTECTLKENFNMCSLEVNTLTDVNGRKYRLPLSEPIPHLTDVKGEYQVLKPLEQPKLLVEVEVDIVVYEECNLTCKLNKQWTTKSGKLLKPPKVLITADSGAMVDCVNRSKLKQFGLSENNLLKSSVSLGCANDTEANVVGTFFANVIGKTKGGKKVKVRTLFYVLKNGGNLLSCTTLQKMGVLPSNFPEIGQFNMNGEKEEISRLNEILIEGLVDSDNLQAVRQPVGQCDPESELPCSCPRHQYRDPPERLPFPAIPENREKLEKWLLEYYASSAFNVCRRQSMPCTEGPPMRIQTKPEAVPFMVHKPSPIPLYWRAEVKAGLDADVK